MCHQFQILPSTNTSEFFPQPLGLPLGYCYYLLLNRSKCHREVNLNNYRTLPNPTSFGAIRKSCSFLRFTVRKMRVSIRHSSPLALLLPSCSYCFLHSKYRVASKRFSSGANMLSHKTDGLLTKNRVALLQFVVSHDKHENLAKAFEFMTRAVEQGKASLLVLPEIWNSPYATLAFKDFAEELPEVGYHFHEDQDEQFMKDSPSARILAKFAKDHAVYIIGGSIPERNESRLFNTCLCFNPNGQLVAKHRKAHLFDIDVPGKICFRESDTLTPGDNGGRPTFFDTDAFGRIGIGICYDIRFPEYALLLTNTYNCNMLVYPGAFNLTTGPAHWELLQRARAVDGQCFVLTASPARSETNMNSSTPSKYPHYTAWGHSTAVSPWGDVLATCDEKEAIVYCDLDITKVDEMRQNIPTRLQKRHDIYQLNTGFRSSNLHWS